MTGPIVAEGLAFDVLDVIDYLPRIRQHLDPGTPAADDGQGARTPIQGSASPWNEEAAAWLFEVHAGAREAESLLCWVAFSRLRRRPGSDRHTLAALRNLPPLVEHVAQVFPQNKIPERTVRQVRSWGRRARRFLDEVRPGEEAWSRFANFTCTQMIDEDDPSLGMCRAALLLAPGWQYEVNPAVHCRACRWECPSALFYARLARHEESA